VYSDVCKYIKKNNLDVSSFRVEAIDTCVGTYQSAIDRLTTISNKLNIPSQYTLSSDAMHIKQQIAPDLSGSGPNGPSGVDELKDLEILCAEKIEQYEATSSSSGSSSGSSDSHRCSVIKQQKHIKIVCECGKGVIKCNMPRHRKCTSHLNWVKEKSVNNINDGRSNDGPSAPTVHVP
jgi:hypothetical protein